MIKTKNQINLKKVVLSINLLIEGGNIRIGSKGIKNLIKASFP